MELSTEHFKQSLINYDGMLLKKFLLLSKGMYKHLIFYLMDQLKHLEASFSHAFGFYFDFINSYITQTPISFCKESGVRIDYILRLKVKNECKKFKGKSMIVSYQGMNINQPDAFLSQY